MPSVLGESDWHHLSLLCLQKSLLLRACSYVSPVHFVLMDTQRPACQRKDWKKHKLNCSLRPDGPLPPANFEDTEELDSEVDRVKQIVKSVYDEWKVATIQR